MDGSVTMKAENFAIEVNGQTLQVMGMRGNVVGMLTNRHRQSETLGMKSPADAVVLFDGSSVDEWHEAKLESQSATGSVTPRYNGNTVSQVQLQSKEYRWLH